MNIPLEIQFQRNDDGMMIEAPAVVVGQHSRFSSGSGSNKDQVPKLMLPKTSGHRSMGLAKSSSSSDSSSSKHNKGDQIPKLMLPKSSEHRRGLGKAIKKSKGDTRPAIPRKQSSIHTLSLSPCSPNNHTRTRNLHNRRRCAPLRSHCFKIEPTTAATRTSRALSDDVFILRDIIVPESSSSAQHPSFRKPSKSF